MTASEISVSSGTPSSTSPGRTSTGTHRPLGGRHLYSSSLSADIWLRPSHNGGIYGPWTCGKIVRSYLTPTWSRLELSTTPPLHPSAAPSFVGPPVALVRSTVLLAIPPNILLAPISTDLSACTKDSTSLPKPRLPVMLLAAVTCRICP